MSVKKFSIVIFVICYLIQVLSGDAVVIRGQPRGGPPPERTLCFSNITAPRLARRANPNVEGSAETKDEVRTLFDILTSLH
jgi:hypothetical protein